MLQLSVKNMSIENYTSPEIDILHMEIEKSICALSNEQLGCDDDVIIL